jgi:hypothetical protein
MYCIADQHFEKCSQQQLQPLLHLATARNTAVGMLMSQLGDVVN